jgi:hypothetical protein
LCLGVVGLFLNFSVVIFEKDKVVRTLGLFRLLELLQVLRLLRLQFYIVINTFSAIAYLVGYLELLAL